MYLGPWIHLCRLKPFKPLTESIYGELLSIAKHISKIHEIHLKFVGLQRFKRDIRSLLLPAILAVCDKIMYVSIITANMVKSRINRQMFCSDFMIRQWKTQMQNKGKAN